ncbi:MAG: hypothetical protein FWD47_11755 [Treponema sp.]|nr:hypothetical protein [Treponema sp.]
MNDFKSDNPDNWLQRNWIPIVSMIICSIVAGYICHYVKMGLIGNIATSLFIAIASFSITKCLVELINFKRCENKLDQALNIMTTNIEHYFPQLFYPNSETLKNKLREVNGKKVAETFVAKKLDSNFKALEFGIGALDYSKLCCELYPKVKTSLFLTNSFDPKEWITRFFRGDKKFSDLEDTLKKETFSVWWKTNKRTIKNLVGDRLKHIQAWKNIKLPVTKRRLNILDDEIWEKFYEQEPYYYLFKEINSITEDDTRFTTHETLGAFFRDVIKIESINVKNYDYGFYDESIVLKWEINSNEENIPMIELTLLQDNDNNEKKFLQHIFNNWSDNPTYLWKAKYVEDKIRKPRENQPTQGANCPKPLVTEFGSHLIKNG